MEECAEYGWGDGIPAEFTRFNEKRTHCGIEGRKGQALSEQFAVPQTAIKVWGVADAFAGAAFAQNVSEDAKVFVNSLSEPFCGVNTGFEAVTWLDNPLAAASIALLPLRPVPGSTTSPAFGLLVLSSPDGQRFSSGMGTDFLQHVAHVAGAALCRLR